METWVSIAIPVVVAIVGSFGALLVYRNTNRKLDSEAADLISQAAARLIEPLSDGIADLNEENERQKIRIRELEKHHLECAKVVEENGRLTAELDEQRSRRQDLDAYVRKLECRITKLEKWIEDNTTFDPDEING